jgi:microcystin-dependent protein
MNRIDFDQTGGYRLETESLSKLQSNYKIFEALADIVGEKAIVKGCNVIGSTTSDGVIYFNGELLDFVGGPTQTKIIIVEEVTNLLFENGENKPTFYKRYAKFGTGIAAVNWSEFNRAYPITSALYLDKIDMFAGDPSNLPWGWYLCNGQNGTSDLRQRFVVGYDPTLTDYNTVGKIGGLKEVELTESQGPIHKHSGSVSIPPQQVTVGQSAGTGAGGGKISTGGDIPEGSFNFPLANTLSGTINLNTSGQGEPHENRPPYYTLAFIQFKGI